MFLVAVSWFFGGYDERFARKISSLPTEERERRLVAMTPELRERVLLWMKDHPVAK
jgi:hypothetical protein